MISRPNIRRMAPYSHGHMGLALNSLNRVCMYEPRTATVVGTITRNGPSVRANMRVRICDCSDVLIATSWAVRQVYRPAVGVPDYQSVWQTIGLTGPVIHTEIRSRL